jgi:hypothetical protein
MLYPGPIVDTKRASSFLKTLQHTGDRLKMILLSS